MKIKLKEDFLNKLLDDIEVIRFTADGGCACGDFGYRLDENLYLLSYRSCRKSGSTPNNKLWHIHDFQFYKKLIIYKDNYQGNEYVSDYEVFEEDIVNVDLDYNQKEIIMSKLKEITIESWGKEFL